MLKILNILIFTVLASWGTSSLATSNQSDDLVPWPWGSECPFPWEKIQGAWVSRGSSNATRFTFNVKGSWGKDVRVLEIKRYNESGDLIATGEGTSHRREKIVRAAMVGVGKFEGEAYWAIIRTYVEVQRRSCARGSKITVVTLRDADGSEEHDLHYVIEKENNTPTWPFGP